MRWLVPLAAGNFLYIGASELVPQVNKAHSWQTNLLHFTVFGPVFQTRHLMFETRYTEFA